MVESARTAALLAWYGSHLREIPWRRTTDPWAILVSEVMAQQTQVSRVIPKWRAFMDRFPDPSACAAASRAELLSMWSGLGYNSRAVRLHEAAARIAEHGWPTTPQGLQSLPGVGPYTAAAVACFAFGAQIPTIDTNLRRVLSRWEGTALDGGDLRDAAEAALPHGMAADWNQAVMDLGASICAPREPVCGICPVTAWCLDPTVYSPPRPQGRFEGSAREARGAVIRTLTSGPATTSDITTAVAISAARVTAALDALQAEGLVEQGLDGLWAIA